MRRHSCLDSVLAVELLEIHERSIVLAQCGTQLAVEIVATLRRGAVEQTLPHVGLGGISLGAVFLHLGEFGSLSHSLVDSSDGIDELNLQGILSEPYPTLCYLIHTLNGNLASVADTLGECLIATVNHVGEILHLLIGERA